MEKAKKQPKESLLEKDISIGGVNLTQKSLFAKHMSVMLKSGLTITEALDIARDSLGGKLNKVIEKLKHSVESGQSFSASLERYPKIFSGLFTSATYAGEKSGTLAESLENITLQLEKEKELISKIKGAMLYPIVVLIASFILGLGMVFFVLPKIIPLFQGLKMDLPITTRALIWFSNFVSDYKLLLFFGIIFFVAFITWLVRQKFSKPVTHFLILKIPIIKNISKGANLVRFCRSLGTLLKSGLNIDESLEITSRTLDNYYYKRAIESVSKRITKGTTLSDDLEQFRDYFPAIVIKMIKVGEESGELEGSLLYLADFYESEVDNATKSLSIAIEPALLIVIGLVVGFLALSIITPIYNITGGIRR